MEYNIKNPNDKISMLILDVKGNYSNQIKKFCKKYNLENDLLIIGLSSNIYFIILCTNLI